MAVKTYTWENKPHHIFQDGEAINELNGGGGGYLEYINIYTYTQ